MKKKFLCSLLILFLSSGIMACGTGADSVNALPSKSGDTSETKRENTSLEEKEEPKISMERFLDNARKPVGSTLYVWGGGWNEEDNGAGTEAVTIGVSPNWKAFYDKNDSSYDYHNTRYQIHDGLDCSGYVGWAVYNTFETENGKEGYVMSSTEMAEFFAGKGWGIYKPADAVQDWKTGDIMSMKGHVWISLGTCKDQSVLLLHSSPPGVRLSGTLNEDGSESEAVRLAREYTRENYPDWDKRYPTYGVKRDYLTTSSQMRWNAETFSDASRFQQLSPEEVLEWMFGR